MIEQGKKVTGTYFGIAFSGVVNFRRPNTMNFRLVEYFVDLDTPISVFGSEPRLALNVQVDGSTNRDAKGEGTAEIREVC